MTHWASSRSHSFRLGVCENQQTRLFTALVLAWSLDVVALVSRYLTSYDIPAEANRIPVKEQGGHKDKGYLILYLDLDE